MHLSAALLPLVALAGIADATANKAKRIPATYSSSSGPLPTYPSTTTTTTSPPYSYVPPASTASDFTSASAGAAHSPQMLVKNVPGTVSAAKPGTINEAKASSITSYASRFKPTIPTTSKKTTTTKKVTTTTKKTTAKTTAKTTTTKKPAEDEKKTTTTTKKTTTTAKKVTTTRKARRDLQKRATSSTTTVSSVAGCSTLEPIYYNYYTANQSTVAYLLDQTYVTQAINNIPPPAQFQTLFSNQQAAVFDNSYLTMIQLSSYNTTECAQHCLNNVQYCSSFNIFFQRQAMYTPNNSTCLNPPARTQVQCSLYGGIINVTETGNWGLWESQFMVLIAGSNGYMRNPVPTPPSLGSQGFTGPVAQPGAVGINDGGQVDSDYLQIYYNSTFNPSYCASQCTTWNSYWRSYYSAHGQTTYPACQQVNIFNVTTSAGTIAYACTLFNDYADTVDNSNYTVNLGGTLYGAVNSWTYDLYPQDPGTLASPAWSAAPQGTAAACSAIAPSGTASVTDYNQVKYTVACNTDLYGYDVGNVQAPDFYSCFNLCDNYTPTCNAFSWVNKNNITGSGGTCYLKNIVGDTNAPTLNPPTSQGWWGSDCAWAASANYAGYSARPAITNSVAATTTTKAWTGSSTTTVMAFASGTGTTVVLTPGIVGSTSGAVIWVTTATDSGTAATITSTTFFGSTSVIKSTKYTTNSKGTTIASSVSSGTYTFSTVQTIYPTPSSCSTASFGSNYRIGQNFWPGGQNTAGYPSFIPEYYNASYTPLYKGVSTYIAEDNDGANPVTVYGNSITNAQATNLVISNTFYVFAGRGTGVYSFQIPYADDATFMWIGSKAISGWSRANNDIQLFWTGSTQTSVTLGYQMTAGTYLPVRVVWGNGGGPGSMQINVWAPDGSYLVQNLGTGSNSALMSRDIVTNPCNATYPVFTY